MDDIIYFFSHNGFYIIIALAIVKVFLILLYKGFDLAYLFENFLVVYSDHGIEPNLKRKRFRMLHNLITVIFYIVLILWGAIAAVVRFAQ